MPLRDNPIPTLVSRTRGDRPEVHVMTTVRITAGINKTTDAGMIAARTIMPCSTPCPGVGYDGGSE